MIFKNLFFIILSLFSQPSFSQSIISPQIIFELLDDKNFFIKSEQLDINKYEALYLASKGNFDLQLEASFISEQNISEYSEVSTQLKQPLPFLGMEITGGTRKNRGSIPSYWDDGRTSEDGEFALGLKMPLLQGLIMDKNRYLLQQSYFQMLRAQESYPQTFLNHYLGIVEKFLEWYVSYKNNDVYFNLYTLATNRQELIKTKNKIGVLSNMDVTENESLVLVRKSLWEQSQLKKQITRRNFALYFIQAEKKNIASDAIPELSVIKMDMDSNFIDIALRSRGDLKAFEYMQKEKELAIQLQKQQRLPELNLEAEYTNPQNDHNMNKDTSRDMKVALSFSYPLWQRKALGDVQKAKTDLELELLKQNFQREKIKTSIHNLKEAILVGEKRLVLANQEVQNNEKLHLFEQKKMLQGISSLINLNIREQALAESRLKQIQLEADLIKNKIELLVTSGQAPIF